MRPTIDELKMRLDGSIQPRREGQPAGLQLLRDELAKRRATIAELDHKIQSLEGQIVDAEGWHAHTLERIRWLCAETGDPLKPEEEPAVS